MLSRFQGDARRWIAGLLAVTALGLISPPSRAGWPYRLRGRRVAETRFAPRAEIQGMGTLGTFEPTPYVYVMGNELMGGGYSPLGTYGDTTMAMYGSTSAFRATTAPVTTYTRGYDGVLHAVPGISFSNPNDPRLSPVVYPTRSSYYYRARLDDGPPVQPRDASMWIDQN
jgi:hypothetical protein